VKRALNDRELCKMFSFAQAAELKDYQANAVGVANEHGYAADD
jgi:hypothetical protein